MRTTRMTAAAITGAFGLVALGAGAAFAAPVATGNGYGAGDGSGDQLMDRSQDEVRDQDRESDCDGSMMRDRDGDGMPGRSWAQGRGFGMGALMQAGGSQAMLGDGSTMLELVDGELSDADAEGLAFMVQEEKLAHDLYVTLGEEWGLRIFERIAVAETRHADAVRSLLDAYGLDDPTLGLEVGEFADDELQALYDALLADGRTSEEVALTVGGLVEETDIEDLRAAGTDEDSIDVLYDRLETGSQHHLTAFVRLLDARGIAYEAQVLSDAELAEIVG